MFTLRICPVCKTVFLGRELFKAFKVIEGGEELLEI